MFSPRRSILALILCGSAALVSTAAPSSAQTWPQHPVKFVIPLGPGLFSTTTGWPHLADSLSANTRAVMSTPEPGPSGITNLTGCCGHVCADDGAAVDTSAAELQRIKARIERRGLNMDFFLW